MQQTFTELLKKKKKKKKKKVTLNRLTDCINRSKFLSVG